jgi:ABC-type sugar transport system ATPase subunit
MASLSLKNIRKSYEDVDVIHGVDLEIADGEFVVFVGPSGCGKSTLLRMIAGLEAITDGELSINGRVVNKVAPAKRGVAMVFQSYALYPHMTVYKNMAFGLKQAKTPAAEIDRCVRAVADTLQITDYLERLPRNLSGGQRQRVAIGRAIVRELDVFLFDEPLSNLDAALRVQTRIEIARLHRSLAATMVYVTHDQVEAMTLADKIVVLNSGRIEQVGSPMTLYERPANLFVAGFIDSPNMNMFDAAASADTFTIDGGGSIILSSAAHNGPIKTGVRPEHLIQCEPRDAVITPRLGLVEQLGEYALVHLTMADGAMLTAKLERPPQISPGDSIPFRFEPSAAHLFDTTTGTRL